MQFSIFCSFTLVVCNALCARALPVAVRLSHDVALRYFSIISSLRGVHASSTRRSGRVGSGRVKIVGYYGTSGRISSKILATFLSAKNWFVYGDPNLSMFIIIIIIKRNI